MEDDHHESLIRTSAHRGSKSSHDIDPSPARASENNPISWDADKHATLGSSAPLVGTYNNWTAAAAPLFSSLTGPFLANACTSFGNPSLDIDRSGNMDLASEGSATRRFIRSLEVPPPKGNTYAITQWVNADLIPMDSSRRTWNGWKYVVYWATGGKLFLPKRIFGRADESLILTSDIWKALPYITTTQAPPSLPTA